MRRGFIVFAFILAFLMVIPCSATQSQGLKWNYGEGSRYDFKETLYQGNSSTLEVDHEWTYYLIAPSYYDLDDTLNTSQGIPVRYAFTYWQNGTEREGEPHMTFAVPVGNWSLLSAVVDSLPDHTSVQHLNTSDTWGYEVTYTTDTSSNTWRWVYSKSTGVLESMRYEVTNPYFRNVFMIERLASGPTTIFLEVAVGAGLFIVLVTYHWRKKILPPLDS